MLNGLYSKLANQQSQSLPPRRFVAFRRRAYRPYLEPLEKRELLDKNTGGMAYGQISLSFELNQGQTDPAIQFLSRGSGYSLFLTSQEAVLSLSKPVAPKAGSAAMQAAWNSSIDPRELAPMAAPVKDVLHLQLVGANAAPRVAGVDMLPGTVNYFLGNHPAQWRTNVPTYRKVAYQDVYPGIDLVYYGNLRQLEYDFVVAPGADPRVIEFSFRGAQNLTLDGQGNLVLHTAGGDVVEHAPVVYQEEARGRQAISGRYVLVGQDRVGFQIDTHDASRPLIIDPVLSYSTYLGGSGDDRAQAITVDASGNAYITGYTSPLPPSADFPTTPGALQMTFGGGSSDAFVSKVNATGTALLYSTYLGGNGSDGGYGIAVDASGNAYVTGDTSSFDFPTTPTALQTKLGGRVNAFVTKLNATGTALIYSTYLGGSSPSYQPVLAWSIAVDATSNAYITGYTASSNFPTTPGALETAPGSLQGGYVTCFVTKLNTTGTALIYSTYLGRGNDDYAHGIAVDASGNAYITGDTKSTNFPTTLGALQTKLNGIFSAFVAKLNATGTALIYSTYLGGSREDYANGIAVDASGNAYVTGDTSSSNFPTTPTALQTKLGGNTDAFVTKLNATGTALIYSTYLGGSSPNFDHSSGSGIAVDATGNAYVTGDTSSPNFPTTPDALRRNPGSGLDAFVTKLNATGTALLYSTYFAGSRGTISTSIAVDAAGNAYITGAVYSPGFPTTPGALQTTPGGSSDAFVTKIGFLPSTATILITSASPSIYGQFITFSTTTVTSLGVPVSTGTVTFEEGNTILAAPVPVDSSGHASFQIATLTSSSTPHAITAYYNDTALETSSGSVMQMVNEAPLLVTADDKTKMYGQPNPAQTVRYSGFVLGQDLSVLSGTLTLSTTATISSNVGNYAITPGGLTSTNYAIMFVSGSLTVTPAPLIVTADDKTKTYGQANPAFTGRYSGFVLGQDPSVLNGTLSFSTLATIGSNVGSYAVIPSGLTSSNYAISFVNGTLTIMGAPLTVLAANASRTYGAANPPLTGTILGIQNNDPLTVTYGTAAMPISNVGSYAILPTLSDGGAGKLANYTVTSINGILTITAAPLTVMTANASRLYGAANPAFTGAIAGIQNGDPITVTYGTAATQSSNVGTYAIIPALSDGGTGKLSNYVVSSNNGTLTVNQAPLTVTPATVSRQFGTPNPVFTGTVSGILNGDNITATYSTTATLTSPVGTYPITATLSDPSNKLSNYSVTLNQGTLTIIPASPFYLVTTTADSGPGSLRDAIAATPSGYTVYFQSGLSGTIVLTTDTLTIAENLTIAGPGAGVITVSGNDTFQVFNIAPAVTITISGLTIANGTSPLFGGGISNDGTLTVSNSIISSNGSGNRGGGIYNSPSGTLFISNCIVSGNSTPNAGAGIYNVGKLMVSNSTLSGNGNSGADGGGIYNIGTLTVSTSTLSGNGGSGAYGGAVRNDGVLTVDSSTFSGNTADLGGGIYNVGTMTARNTILAGNIVSLLGSGPDLFGGIVSLGHNLIGDTSGGSGFVASDLVNVNPLLGPLQDNGGPTFTMALLPGSPAIDAGDNTDALDFDQRGPGFPRIVGGIIDIGAYEVQLRPAPPSASPVLLCGMHETGTDEIVVQGPIASINTYGPPNKGAVSAPIVLGSSRQPLERRAVDALFGKQNQAKLRSNATGLTGFREGLLSRSLTRGIVNIIDI